MPLRWVLIRDPAGAFAPQALRCTDPTARPEQILGRFVQRWQREVTCEEARRRLGVETQRQWSELAIRRTTPALPAPVSLVTLLAHPRMAAGACVRQAAWYPKALPTFADALAAVRRQMWEPATLCTPARPGDIVEAPRAAVERLTDALCYAA